MKYPKLKKDVKKKWLKALRSGEYEKGIDRLVTVPYMEETNDNYQFCCLGVLADVAVKDGAAGWYDESYEHDDPDFEDTLLPPKISEWAFGTGLDGQVLEDLQGFLASRNDGSFSVKGTLPKAWTHKRIADWIEANL